MKNKVDQVNLLTSPRGARSSHQKSLPFIPRIKSSMSGEIKSPTPDLSHPKNPILFASHTIFPRPMAPLSSQRAYRLELPSSPQFSRPDKQRQSFYSSTPQDFNSTFRSGFFTLGEVDEGSNDKVITNPERISKMKNKLAVISKKRNELKKIEFFNETQNANITKMMFYLNEFYSKIFENENSMPSKYSLIFDIMLEIEGFLHLIVNDLISKVHELTGEKKELKQRIDSLEKEIKFIDLKFQERTQKDLDEINHLKHSLKQRLAEKSRDINVFQVQIQKIESEKEKMEKTLESVLSNQDVHALKREMETLRSHTKTVIEELESNLKHYHSLADTYELKLLGLRGETEKLTQTNHEKEFKIQELKLINEQNEKLIAELQERSNMYRERALMQKADYEGMKLELLSFQENFATLREKYLQEKAKLDKLMEEKQKMNEISGLENMLQDLTVFHSLQEIFASKMFTGRAIEFKKVKDSLSLGQMDLKQYMIAVPTFQFLFMGKKIYEKIEEPKFKVDFVATIRAIFDSKYNEFLYTNDYKQISRFPDFAYAWTGKFVLCPYQRKVRMADIKDPDPEIFRNEVIRLLNTQMAQKIWDCIIFKEFLDEVHTRDELIYFLQCRNLVFKGPQLNDPSASFSFVHYIRYEWAEVVLEHLIGEKYDRETLLLIKQKLREKIKVKNEKNLIDSAFFLRVLLEEYKKEKKERFVILKNIINQEPNSNPISGGKFTISFESFKNILITYFPETSDLEKAELYRKAWTIGHGIVDSESILTVLNEENYFSNLIKFRSLQDPPTFDKNYEYEDTKNNLLYKLIAEKHAKMSSSMEAIKNAAFSLGVEKLVIELFDYEKLIRNKFQASISELKGRSLYLWINSLLMHAAKINCVFLSISSDFTQIKEATQIKALFNIFDKAFNDLITVQNNDIVREFEINVRIRKVQKFIKSKLSTWYKLMSFILKNKIERYHDKQGRVHFLSKKL